MILHFKGIPEQAIGRKVRTDAIGINSGIMIHLTSDSGHASKIFAKVTNFGIPAGPCSRVT
jgi:hypothetical protein